MAQLNDSIRQFLSGRHYAVLATVDDDTSVHLTPVWYIFEDDCLYVGTPSWSRKARNLARRPNASLVVDVRKAGRERWVSASGPVELIRDQRAAEIVAKIQRRYLTEAALNDPRIGPAFAATDDLVICLRPATWRSWSSTEVDARFFGGVLGQSPEKWFLPAE